jgi:hypothetical protein
MVIPKLTLAEIQQKIDLFALRKQTLEDIVKDMDDVGAKNALEVQMNNYQKSLDLLEKELTKRQAL